MALNFPANPVDGQVYPDPAPSGGTQYVYNASKGTWLTVFRGVDRVSGIAPIEVTGEQSNPVVSIKPATTSTAGSMSAADKTKLDNLGPSGGSVTNVKAGIGLGAPNTGDSITTTGTLNLLAPTPLSIGGVKPGDNVAVGADGTLTVKPPTPTTIGAVKEGEGVDISADGSISLSPGATFKVLDSLTGKFDGTTTNFQMTVNSVPFAPSSYNSLLIFVGGVNQVPLVSFSTSGSTLIFTSAPPTGVSFYGISLT